MVASTAFTTCPGGQFAPESGGQFPPELGGQFPPESGGQYQRILQERNLS